MGKEREKKPITTTTTITITSIRRRQGSGGQASTIRRHHTKALRLKERGELGMIEKKNRKKADNDNDDDYDNDNEHPPSPGLWRTGEHGIQEKKSTTTTGRMP
jgi:hypothetical protein